MGYRLINVRVDPRSSSLGTNIVEDQYLVCLLHHCIPSSKTIPGIQVTFTKYVYIKLTTG